VQVYISDFRDYAYIHDKYARFFLCLSQQFVQKCKDVPDV